jgi:hypothetical protein
MLNVVKRIGGEVTPSPFISYHSLPPAYINSDIIKERFSKVHLIAVKVRRQGKSRHDLRGTLISFNKNHHGKALFGSQKTGAEAQPEAA